MSHSPDKKKKASAIADLLNGDQPAIVAARYKLNAATVRSWKARFDADDGTVATGVATPAATMQRKPAVEAQQIALGDLVMDNLRAKLVATQRIAEHVSTNTEWLSEQNAADVATLFESLDRSAIGILDRLAQRSGGRGAAGDDADPARISEQRPDRLD